MFRTILKYGTIAGLIVGIPLAVLCLVMKDEPPATWGMVVGYLTMLVAFSMIFIAVKRERDLVRGGIIRFWPALGIGLGISLVASIFYVLAWEAALAITGADFIGAYSSAMIEQQRASGASAEALAALAAEMRQFADQYANPLFRMPMTFAEIFPIGVLVSLVSAALLRNSRFLAVRRG